MTTTNVKYNSAATAITCTINSLASSATVGRQSTVIDNTANLYVDAEVEVVISTGASTPVAPSYVAVYVSGSGDGGTNFDQDSAVMGASDASYTLDASTNLKLAAIINCSTLSKVYNTTFSVAQLFGGVMPSKWVIVVCNVTGQTLKSTGCSASYTGITYTSA